MRPLLPSALFPIAVPLLLVVLASLPAHPRGAPADANGPAMQPPQPPAGLPVVGHWRFQFGIQGVPARSLIFQQDASGNDRHAYVVGEPLYRTVQLPSSNLALAFDGDDDRLFVPDDPVFQLTHSFTLEAYVQVDRYPNGPSKLSQIVCRGDGRAGFDPWFLAVGAAGQLVFGVSDAFNQLTVVCSPEPLPVGRLLHVAGTLDDATGEQIVYLDGRQVASAKTSIRSCGPLGGPEPGIGIANLPQASDQGFRGTIDEVRITAAALAPAQLLPPPGSDR